MIWSLNNVAAQDASVTGGKAKALARLIAAGFPVPEGFVVTAMEDVGPSLSTRLDRHALYAVRSSGYSEDSATASFAGQYESVLGVRGLDEVSNAIGRCFASFSNSRSAAYSENRNGGNRGGAVIVQRLVEAEAAGVAFTIDPVTGAVDRVLIESNFGLGESVVGGHVNPDGFTVRKDTGDIVERRIGDKRVKSALDSNGTSLVPAADDVSQQPSLADDAIRAVAALARRVEEHYSAPVDIEWAWKDAKAWLLQARPVTAAGGRAASLPPPGWSPELNTRIDPKFPLYSSGNVSEILPGCVTPLTYSFFSRGVERAFRDMSESVGSMPDVGPRPIVVGFFFHRVYLNASYFMTAADNSPGASRDRVYEDLIGPSPARHPAFTWGDLLPWRLVRGAGIILKFLALQGKLPKDIEECRAQYAKDRKRFEPGYQSRWSNDELAEWIEPLNTAFDPASVHIRASQFAVSSFGTLRGMTRKSLADLDGALASTLVTGIGSIAGTNPASALYEISRLVMLEPSLRALFSGELDDQRLLAQVATSADPAFARLRKALADFSDRFGHRGFREAEFRCPCWREQPAAVIAHVRNHLESGGLSPQEIAERQASLSAEARRGALARLPSLRRGIFESVLDSTRKHIAAREEMKDLLLLFLDLTRRVIAMSQERLKDVLGNPDDIYFLLTGEVAAALRGRLSATEIATIVERRRRDFEWSSKVFVPKVQDGIVKCLDNPEMDASKGQLSGIPVSPGQVEGRARVVLDPTGATIAPGEILVAPVTDVAWTPLFLRAGGLIVEVGGPLSHGSIVAREYGIPAVTAVAGATTRIRTGDLLRLDGDRGVVTITTVA